MKKLLTVGFVLASAAALATDYTARNNEDMALGEGDTLTISANTTVTAGKLTGTGKVTINSGVTLTDSTLFGEGFTGTVEVNGGTFEFKGSFNHTHPFTAAAQIVLSNGGKLRETNKGVNLYMTNNVEIVGTGNEIYSAEANVNVQGKLLGSGSVLLNTYKRGVRLFGDNSGFKGTAEYKVLENEGKWQANGFWTATAGSTNATWNFTTASAFTQGGFTYSYVIYYAKDSANPLHLGALNLTNPKTVISTCGNADQDSYRDRSYIVIGEKNEDCTIEGGFCRAPITFTKKGTAKLTLGTNFTCVAGSQMTVEAGTLEVKGNASNLKVKCTGDGKVVCLAGGKVALADGELTTGFSGAGTYIVTNGTSVASFDEADGVNYFTNITGTIEFAAGGTLQYLTTHTNTSVISYDAAEKFKPFGDAKLRFTGGTLQGFSQKGSVGSRNNVTINNEIEVVGGTESTILNNNATDGASCNIFFTGKITGSGKLTVQHEWNQYRTCDFTGDMSGFTGFLNLTGGGYSKIKGGVVAGATTGWNMNNQDHLMLEFGSGTIFKFGSLASTRTDGRQYINSYYANQTIEVGARYEDATLNAKFTNCALTIRKVGYGNWTFGSTVSFVDGTTFEVAPAADGVTGPGDPTGVAGAATEYTLLTLTGGKTATVTQPTGDTWVSEHGKWRVVSETADGTTTYKLVWSPNGLMIIVR